MNSLNAIRDYKIRMGNIFICVEIDNKKRELFSLNFNDKREMFYIFPYNSTQIIDTRQNNQWRKQRRDDHVSFHRDGHIHTMYKL